MGVIWKQKDLLDLRTELGARGAGGIAAVERIMEETVAEAAELQRTLLDRAETEGGRARIARGRGNTAGRNDEGLMIGSITHDITSTGKKVTGIWGWPFHAEEYFQWQDYGTGKIKPAHSLLDSFVIIREKFAKRLSDLVK